MNKPPQLIAQTPSVQIRRPRVELWRRLHGGGAHTCKQRTHHSSFRHYIGESYTMYMAYFKLLMKLIANSRHMFRANNGVSGVATHIGQPRPVGNFCRRAVYLESNTPPTTTEPPSRRVQVSKDHQPQTRFRRTKREPAINAIFSFPIERYFLGIKQRKYPHKK